MTAIAYRIRSWLDEPLPGTAIAVTLCFMVAGAFIILGGVVHSFYYDQPSCKAKTDMMGIESHWSFHTGCMLRIKDQWLPWSEVVAVDRNGKIVFEPKPHVRIGQ